MDQSQQLNNSNLKIDHHVELVENLIKLATEEEKKNYITYLKALKDGLLENHRGRYILIRNGKMLNKSFKRAHDIFDRFPPDSGSFPSASSTFAYVPLNIH
mmetsp:Transcript_32449/g.44312  ORF Transcript_32449/g.44312 Transcript_32449/m.44312 type:complete len:101 (-) Transcript_32449:331-633(-)